MMNKTITAACAALALALTTVHPAGAAETYKIGPDNSKVLFKIDNKAPGASDYMSVPGSFKEFSGTWVMGTDPAKNSVEMEVQTTSVDTANERRDNHLRNQDFFKVKEFPTMTFKSTSFKKVADDTFEVTGDFTLLGKTKPVKVSFKKTGAHAGTATFRIKRSEFGMTFRVPDTADEVDVTLEIAGAK